MTDRPPRSLDRARAARLIRIAGIGVSAALAVAYLAAWWTAPPFVIFGADSWGYLRPALLLNQGGDFVSTSRPFGYPMFVAVALAATGSLAEMPAVQTFLAAGTAMLAVGAVHACAPARWRANPAGAFAVACVSAMVSALILAYQPITNQAQELIPEPLYSFLGAAVLLLTALVVVHARPLPLRLALYIVAALVSAYAFHVKPHWGAAMLCGWAATTLALSRTMPGRWPRRVAVSALAFATSALLAALFFFVPQYSLYEKHSRYARSFGPLTLFCNHADLIAPVVHTLSLPPAVADEIHGLLRKTVADGPNHWPLLGFNGDDCVYRSRLFEFLGKAFGDDVPASRAFMLRAFQAGILNDPGAYATKVLKQIGFALARPFPNADRARDGDPSEYLRVLRTTKPDWGPYLLTSGGLSGQVPRPLWSAVPVLAAPAAALLTWLNGRALLVWGAVLALSAAAAGGLALRGLRPTLAPALVAVGLYLSSLLVVAVAHTFDIDRYREAAAPLAILALAVAGLQLVSHLALLAGSILARTPRIART